MLKPGEFEVIIAMTFNLPETVLYQIQSFAKQYSIKKVVLFGSRARGTHSMRSDIDIAVSGGDFDAFLTAINEEAETLLQFDVVDLGANVSDELLKEINRDGVILYEED